MFGRITHDSLTTILNYVDKILVFENKGKHFEFCFQLLHNS